VPPIARKDAARAYRQVEEPAAQPRPTDAGSLLVGQIMNHPVLTLPIDATAEAASTLMAERGIRHVPVVASDGRLAGLVVESDLFAAARGDRQWARRSLQSVMIAEVVTLSPEMSLREAARRLADRGHAGAPVVGPDERPVGFLSARDLLSVLVKRAPLTLWV